NDLSRLTAEQRDEVLARFGPEPEIRLYHRGVRRRMATMLGNDLRWLELAYSLQFTLRGTPVLRYGEEIGMGEDLELPGWDAIRTPMQWSDHRSGGFSDAPAGRLIPPVLGSRHARYPQGHGAPPRPDPPPPLRRLARVLPT